MPYTYLPFYDVSRGVGRGQPNSTLDVMLVQFMMGLINLNSGWETYHVFPGVLLDSGPAAIYPADGIYKPDLSNWIREFQAVANRTKFGPLTVDGIVSPCKKAWGNKHLPKGNYTIQAMNHILAASVQYGSQSDRFWNFADAPGIPGPLAKELKFMRLSAIA